MKHMSKVIEKMPERSEACCNLIVREMCLRKWSYRGKLDEQREMERDRQRFKYTE